MTPLRLLPKLGAWLSLWLLAAVMLSAPALAQTAQSDAAEAGGGAATYATLADLLENDQSRQELVELLRDQAADLPEGTIQQQLPEQAPEQAAQGSDIAPDVKAAIAAPYPDDDATGFKPGELRGAFSIRWEKAALKGR